MPFLSPAPIMVARRPASLWRLLLWRLPAQLKFGDPNTFSGHGCLLLAGRAYRCIDWLRCSVYFSFMSFGRSNHLDGNGADAEQFIQPIDAPTRDGFEYGFDDARRCFNFCDKTHHLLLLPSSEALN